MALLTLSSAVTLQAEFVKVADFEDGTLGNSVSTLGWGGTPNALPYSTVAQDPAAAGNQVLQTTVSTASNGIYLNLPAAGIIAANTTGTIFFQMRFEAAENYNVNFGVGNSGSGDRTLQAQIRTQGTTPNEWDVYSSGTGPLKVTNVTTRNVDVWYNVWIVINPDGVVNEWEAYLQLGEDAPLQVATASGSTWGFKQNNGLNAATDRFAIHFGGVSDVGAGNASPVYFDNIYVDNTGRNLASPVPEAGAVFWMGGAGVAALAVCLRRRRGIRRDC